MSGDAAGQSKLIKLAPDLGTHEIATAKLLKKGPTCRWFLEIAVWGARLLLCHALTSGSGAAAGAGAFASSRAPP